MPVKVGLIIKHSPKFWPIGRHCRTVQWMDVFDWNSNIYTVLKLPFRKLIITPICWNLNVSCYHCTNWTKAILEYIYFGTIELKWLENLWNHENMFETGIVRANET